MSTQSILPLVVVMGATGQQGGSVVDHLLKGKLYRVRGITRDPTSAASVALIKRGVEMVKAHAGSLEQLTAAFSGAHAAFAVTNFWDAEIGFDPLKEVQQGKNAADAAVAAHVSTLVWSSLPDAETAVRCRQGALWDAHHFTSKHRVEEYIRTLPINAVFVYAGFYTNNFGSVPFFQATRLSATSVEWALPLRAHVGLPIFDVADTGLFVTKILARSKELNGAVVLMATEYLTLDQVAATYARVSGETAIARVVPMNPAFPDAVVSTFRWFNEFGYYDGLNINQTNQSSDWGGSSWEQYLRKSNWRID